MVYLTEREDGGFGESQTSQGARFGGREDGTLVDSEEGQTMVSSAHGCIHADPALGISERAQTPEGVGSVANC